MTKPDHLRALARICRQLGGRLAIVSQRTYDGLFYDRSARIDGHYDSPFTCDHGVNWPRRWIYTVRGREEIGSIIHEMGHVFADAYHPEDRACCEWNWFGWEVAVARQIGATRVWSQQNGNYGINGDGREWGGLAAKERRAVIADRLGYAQKIGVLDTNGMPRSIR